jgi:hypothetical protein
MPATGFTPIQLYRTATGAAAPLAANLTAGELFINYADTDMAIYAKNASLSVKRIMNNPAGLKYPTADGTVGQVVSTDGAGALAIGAAAINLPAATTVDSQYISPYTMRNRLMNGAFKVLAGVASATVTAGDTVPTVSTGYPVSARWFVYSAGGNPTVARVAGTGSTQYRLQVTGAASVTAIGVGQRIEALNCWDLVGSHATLSVDISNSVLTSVVWTASYATTTENTFGTIGTPTKTQIATGTFTVTSSIARYSVDLGVIPAGSEKGIEILFTVGAQTSGTWVLGDIQLEKGAIATPFEFIPYPLDLWLCRRYYFTESGGSRPLFVGLATSTTTVVGVFTYPNNMRTGPTLVVTNPANFLVSNGAGVSIASTAVANTDITSQRATLVFSVAAGLTVGQASYVQFDSGGTGQLLFMAEIP